MLLQIPEDPRPTFAEFATVSEPGEEERNAFDRTMVYYRWQWLMSRKRGFTAKESDRVDELGGGEKIRIHLSLVPHRRGLISMNRVRALLPDPLGFFQKCREIKSPPGCLIVLPKRYKLAACLDAG